MNKNISIFNDELKNVVCDNSAGTRTITNYRKLVNMEGVGFSDIRVFLFCIKTWKQKLIQIITV